MTEIPPSTVQFFSKLGVWDYLDSIDVSENEKSFLSRAFRTRCRIDSDQMDFQFRFSPESIESSEMDEIEAMRNSLAQRLGKILPKKKVVVTLKISPCCGKDCFGCEQYGIEK